MISKKRILPWGLLSLLLIVVAVGMWRARPDGGDPSTVPGASERFVQPDRDARSTRPGDTTETDRVAVDLQGTDAPAHDAMRDVEFLVIDSRSRQPLLGASLHAHHSGEEAEVLATSGRDGAMRVERARMEGRDVMCWMEGYSRERVAAPASVLPAKVVIELAPSLALQGRLVVPPGDVVPYGLFVLAWPESELPPVGKTLPELLSHPYCLLTESGEGGEFTVYGRPHTFYSVSAGGKGWATTGVSHAGRPGDRTAEVMVHRIYGVELRLRSEGAPLRLNPYFGGWNYGTPELPEAHERASRVKWTSPGAALNVALQWAIEDARTDPWSRIPLFVEYFRPGIPTASVLEGLSMDIEFPGYRPTQVFFNCPRLESSIKTVTVELEAIGAGFGSLTLDIDPRHEEALLRDGGSRLTLWPAGGDREFDLLARGAEGVGSGVSWDGVPAGSYRATFAASHSPEEPLQVRAWAGGDEVVVVGGGITRTVIARDDLGLLVLEPQLEGRPYSGSLSVQWRVTDVVSPRPQWSPRNFRGPPYHLPVTPGSYELEVRRPFFREVDPPGAEFEMEPGGTIVIELLLERRTDG